MWLQEVQPPEVVHVEPPEVVHVEPPTFLRQVPTAAALIRISKRCLTSTFVLL